MEKTLEKQHHTTLEKKWYSAWARGGLNIHPSHPSDAPHLTTSSHMPHRSSQLSSLMASARSPPRTYQPPIRLSLASTTPPNERTLAPQRRATAGGISHCTKDVYLMTGTRESMWRTGCISDIRGNPQEDVASERLSKIQASW